MELLLKRKIKTSQSTIGDLFVNGKRECYVLEDADRGLVQSMPLTEIKSKKIYGKTAIPAGRYEIAVSYSNKFKKFLPLLINVPGFDGIRIHSGNVAADSEGCILPGQTTKENFVGASRLAFDALFPKIISAIKKEKVFISIKEEATMINRQHFFDSVRASLFGGSLSQSQVEGMSAIIDEWEKRGLTDLRWLAYMLATAYHETAKTIQPIEEFVENRRGKPYNKTDANTGKKYYGRGFVQLTWLENYTAMGKLLKVDLIHRPELALDLKIATQILFEGMIRGMFTGVKLSTYFNDTKEDWVNARRIINGTDKAEAIAGYGRKFYEAVN